MYIPKHFEQPSIEAMHEHIRTYPFATLITLGSGGLCANHLPMHFSADLKPLGLLSCHVPRSNPVWRDASGGSQALAVFHGPHAYITPSWYASKHETGRVVPTWNYTVVHAVGPLRVIDDAGWLTAHLSQLTAQQEASRAHPWALSDAPVEYIKKLASALVGLEIPIGNLQGKWKLSQNRSEADLQGVVSGLRDAAGPVDLKLAALVERGTD